MNRVRGMLVTYGLPALYLALVVVFNLPEKPEYWLPGRTVMTVTEKAGPVMILHMPDPIYPAQALRDSVQGTVTVKVSVAADGAVSQATALAGPEALRDAAVDAVRRWQFEGKALETQVDVGFSLLYVTQSLTPAEPLERTRPSYPRNARGNVRVVAAVDAEGKPGSVQAVAGPRKLPRSRRGFRPPVDLPANATATDIPYKAPPWSKCRSGFEWGSAAAAHATAARSGELLRGNGHRGRHVFPLQGQRALLTFAGPASSCRSPPAHGGLHIFIGVRPDCLAVSSVVLPSRLIPHWPVCLLTISCQPLGSRKTYSV